MSLFYIMKTIIFNHKKYEALRDELRKKYQKHPIKNKMFSKNSNYLSFIN